MDKCPACGAPASPFRRSYDPPMFECDTVLDADGNIDDQGMQCLRNQLAAARAEAERWRRRHDALRAAVIKAEADYASRADGLDDALMILRQLLAEAGR